MEWVNIKAINKTLQCYREAWLMAILVTAKFKITQPFLPNYCSNRQMFHVRKFLWGGGSHWLRKASLYGSLSICFLPTAPQTSQNTPHGNAREAAKHQLSSTWNRVWTDLPHWQSHSPLSCSLLGFNPFSLLMPDSTVSQGLLPVCAGAFGKKPMLHKMCLFLRQRMSHIFFLSSVS